MTIFTYLIAAEAIIIQNSYLVSIKFYIQHHLRVLR